jgi:hypothetical protein
MSGETSVTIRRLSDLEEWEFYRVVPPEKEGAAYTIGLRPYTELEQVEYEVWDDAGAEPRGSGSVACRDVGERWHEMVSRSLVDSIVKTLGAEG